MEPQGTYDDDDLSRIMQRLAEGDEAAVVTLYERYGGAIAAAVRRVSRHRPGRLADDEVAGVALEVRFDLAVAAAGRPRAGAALGVGPPGGQRRRPGAGPAGAPLDEERLAPSTGWRATGGAWPTSRRCSPPSAAWCPSWRAPLLAEALDRGGVSTRDSSCSSSTPTRATRQRSPCRRRGPGVRHARGVGPPGGPPGQRLLRLAATDERLPRSPSSLLA